MRTATAVGILVIAILAIAIVGRLGGELADTPEVPPTDKVNRIAYVSPLREIVIVDADGSNQETISPEEGAAFTWPTWSPNGRHLAFSAIVPDLATGTHQSYLFNFNVISSRVSSMFDGEPGMNSFVAAGAPHYTQWSPNSEMIAFIASSSDGLELHVLESLNKVSSRHLLDNGPLWIDWSQDSTSLLVHRGTDHFAVDVRSGTRADIDVDSDQFGHRVAKWIPDGGGITYLVESLTAGYALNVSSTEGQITQIAEGLPPGATFQWSPNSQSIAISDPEVVGTIPTFGLLVFSHVSIYDAGGEVLPFSIEGPVVSFFWSPDSSKIGYVTMAQDFSALEWHVLDVIGGETWKLVDFRPSLNQLTVFQFFDQYVESHTMWSPDSQSLVFAGTLAGRGRSVSPSAAQQEFSQVYVVTVDRQPKVYVLAEGSLAFWSPK